GRIPSPQIEYSTIVLTKPDAASVGTSQTGDVTADLYAISTAPSRIYVGPIGLFSGHLFADGQVYELVAADETGVTTLGSDYRVTYPGHGVTGAEPIVFLR